MHQNLSDSTLKCISQKGKVLSIDRAHFELILKQKDSAIWHELKKRVLNQELNNLNIIEKRGKLKEQVIELAIDKPSKPLDMELMYMDEIRE
jgi:hypothetical protein